MAASIWRFFHRRQAVEPRHQRVLKGRWDRQRRQSPVEPIALGVLDEDVPFQHRLGELLDEQRVAVGLGDNLVHHFGGQRTAASHPRHYASTSLRSSRASVKMPTLGRPIQRGSNSDRKVNSARTGSWRARSKSDRVARGKCRPPSASSNKSRMVSDGRDPQIDRAVPRTYGGAAARG